MAHQSPKGMSISTLMSEIMITISKPSSDVRGMIGYLSTISYQPINMNFGLLFRLAGDQRAGEPTYKSATYHFHLRRSYWDKHLSQIQHLPPLQAWGSTVVGGVPDLWKQVV